MTVRRHFALIGVFAAAELYRSAALPLTVNCISLRYSAEDQCVRFLLDGRDLGVQAGTGDNSLPCPWQPSSDIREFRTVIDDDVVNAGGRDVVLFACECGQVACSSVLVDVEVVNDMVRFTNFRDSQAPARSKRAIRSAGLAVEFDRHAYVAQIQALRQAASQP